MPRALPPHLEIQQFHTSTDPIASSINAQAAYTTGGPPAAITVSHARKHLKAVLDHAASGATPLIQRSTTRDRLAVVDAGRLRDVLARCVNLSAVVVHEAGEWAAFLPGLPISASGATLDEAVDDLVLALREYAEDWPALAEAPNHSGNWALVQLVALSSDDELRDWLSATAA